MSSHNGPRFANLKDHALIGAAEKIPINEPRPVISLNPIVLPAPNRIIDLHIRVTAPVTGEDLPIILFSHGHHSSSDGYAPLANFWAAHGFVVIQPTHLSSKTLSLGPEAGPDAPWFWRSRVEDMKIILDELYSIEAAFPHIQGRLDHSRIAVAGHSMGGHTASLLLGARTVDPVDGSVDDLSDSRIRAGVLLAAPGDGKGGVGLRDMFRDTFLTDHNHAEMSAPALVVIGDSDGSPHLTSRGPLYNAGAYYSSKGPKSLFIVHGGQNGLGGISGYDTGADDESPERLASVQRMTWAYLRSRLYPEDPAWSDACFALKSLPGLGRVESK